ncbi:hypothetical protein V1264_012247 [Littorina saxatilis]|uniref:H15 domain-containing protein n=1 Tax=Littorina saxatilis TaxID=31220 RepID=A0AAN9GNA2_9CAEN
METGMAAWTDRSRKMRLKEAELVNVLIDMCDKNGSSPSKIGEAFTRRCGSHMTISKSSIKRALQRAVQAGRVQKPRGGSNHRFRLTPSMMRFPSRHGRKGRSKGRKLSKRGRKKNKKKKSKRRKKSKKGRRGKSKKGRRGKKKKGRGRKRGRKGKGKGRKRGRKKKAKAPKKKKEPAAAAAPAEEAGRCSRLAGYFGWNKVTTPATGR